MFGNKGSKNPYRAGGTRGGQDQFKWDDVKTDKYRENYLGNSVLAPVGRWQKGRDLTWYAKNKEDLASSLEEERRRMKELDDDILNASLGIKAKKKWNENTSLDTEDLKQLLARGSAEETAGELADRGKGLGNGQARVHDHIERKSQLQRQIEQLKTGTAVESDIKEGLNYISLPAKDRENIDETFGEKKKDDKKHKKKHHKDQKSSKKKKKHKDDRGDSDGDRKKKRRREEEERHQPSKRSRSSSSESSRSSRGDYGSNSRH